MPPRVQADAPIRLKDSKILSGATDPCAFALPFGTPAADVPHLLEGWSGPEGTFRWAIGPECGLRLPVLRREDYFLTLTLAPVPLPKRPAQQITLVVNDTIARRFAVAATGEYSIYLPKELLRKGQDNTLRFLFGYFASPGELATSEDRPLTVAFHRLSLDAANFEPFARSSLLPLAPAEPERTPEELQQIAERFQSLGQNCEFGLWQRRCNAEPLGLLRFASIHMEHLLHGLRTDFAGVDDPSLLKIEPNKADGEFMGHHAYYGLDYHTGKSAAKTKLSKFTKEEPERLGYLARMLLEQIDTAERIFVAHRFDLLNDENVMPLFLALRARNPEAQLLYVTGLGGANPALAGRVEQTAPGLFHGYLARLAPSENAYDLDFDGWLKLCAAVDLAVPEG